MVEALVALLVLCLGLLGLGQFMALQLRETRLANGRAMAMSHIDYLQAALSLNLIAPDNADPPEWKTLDQLGMPQDTALQGALAAVFRSAEDPAQVGIAMAWLADENAANAANALLPQTLRPGLDCPPLHLCHLVYVHS
ncbi:hypothetical protein GT347_00600 [Xylophilus rhododendri]|uniref:Uncharacterized protein n=1 Tax=Xylophilus rhododendri TaxID=2697032 RepID=A0A857IZ95_9BURK|nr:hypothetical protein [Xylophilus rhododendri]QHI96627.1 hypothetical protein GT347_00600 [Xylophilus rhododendri]